MIHPNPPFRVTEIISAVSAVTDWPVDRIIERYSRATGRVERLCILIGCLRELTHPQRSWPQLSLLVGQLSHHPTQMRYYNGWLKLKESERDDIIGKVRYRILMRRRMKEK